MRITKTVIAIAAVGILTGCTALKEKTVAIESKVYGVDLQVPNLYSSSSIACLKLGVIITRFADAPEGGEVDMSTTYNDISFWTGSGNGTTTFKIKGPAIKTEEEATKTEEK